MPFTIIANAIDVDLIRAYGVTGFGELLAHKDEHERAVALLTLAADFPTTDPDIKARRPHACKSWLPCCRRNAFSPPNTKDVVIGNGGGDVDWGVCPSWRLEIAPTDILLRYRTTFTKRSENV
ncbi:MAG: hypothetical protein R2932_17185 [Caldilineaceae bacterium]